MGFERDLSDNSYELSVSRVKIVHIKKQNTIKLYAHGGRRRFDGLILMWWNDRCQMRCWSTKTRRKRLIIILSNRYTGRTEIAVRPSPAQAWKVTWYPDTRQQNGFAGDHSIAYIGSKQRSPCRTWKVRRFITQQFHQPKSRRSRNPYSRIGFQCHQTLLYPQTSGFKHGQL